MKKIITHGSFIILAVAPAQAATSSSGSQNYLLGGIIAFLIMCYLVYSLIKPEKF